MIPKYVHCLGFLGCFKDMFSLSTKSTSTPLLGQALEEVDFLKETHVLLEASTGRQQSSPLRGEQTCITIRLTSPS